jgi:molecular chaperone GrpE
VEKWEDGRTEPEPGDHQGDNGGAGTDIDERPTETTEAAAEDSRIDWESLAEDRYQQILRLRADFENFRRRVDREREELRGIVAEEIFSRLLTVYDNLDRALKAMPDTPEAAAWRTGIAMTHKSFVEVLKSQGVEPVPTAGQNFDPAIHEAILRTPDSAPEGTVLEELQAGFRWGNRVLRAALVRVSAGPEESREDAGTDGGA